MKVFNKIKQGLTFHKANKNYFQNIVFSKDIKSQNSIFFINSKDLLENSEYENWRQKYPIQSEEFKKSGMTIINNNKKTFLISNNTKERKQLIKNINSSISTLMALNCKSVQINFSKGIFCNKEKGFILNQLYSSNYIPNENNFSRLQREKYKKQIVPSTIKELRVFQDETMEKNKNKIELGIILGKAKNFSRELANTRPNIADCDFMENEARKVIEEIKDKVSIEVIKGNQLLEEKMNLFHAVGGSAQSEPRLIILKYEGLPQEKSFSHCILGKGLTFDTGGINLKPTGYLEDMFLDKHGACNSLAVFKYLKDMNIKLNIICALAVAENSIDSKSYKPSDIITSRKGFTVEIGNTDAEGRLCLVDSMTYIQDKYKPEVIIDMATLTGACMVALGTETAGIFGDSNLCKKLINSSMIVNESLWELPIKREHRQAISSSFADLTNSSAGDRFGGASQAAAFLEAFVEQNTKWAHLDIAGPAGSKFGTGFGVQTILSYLKEESKKEEINESTEVPIENLLSILDGKDGLSEYLV